jgi:hypothetical protein
MPVTQAGDATPARRTIVPALAKIVVLSAKRYILGVLVLSFI